ncbi:MAG: AI-2E family transporter [Alphaproteobacteria bacterium]|nr:MAG: AI-2E family transporter [Alphaproteobacteria bacterium]
MNRWVWIGSIAVTVLFFYLTRGVLLPFLTGLAVAYFLDPLADRLEARKVPRSLAAAMVISLFFILIAGVILAFWPVLQSQLAAAAHTLPKTLAGIRPWISETMQSLSAKLGPNVMGDVDSMLGSVSTELLAKLQSLAGEALKGGLAVFNLLSLILIAPVVAFYLLRDWDLLVAKVNGWLPAAAAPTVRDLATKIDTVLAGFVRGQLLVSTTMGVMYAVGWSLVGLQSGIVLGVLAGVMSFVPFVGALFAAIVAVAMAIGQWGFDPTHIALVAMIFVIVQAIEGSFLTPRLVGGRVGLHPVWVLFAVFAGGEIMGFVGVLIAVPAAAAIAVLVRYWIERYMAHYVPESRGKASEKA